MSDVSAVAGKRILIVEDDAIIARIYQNRLTREGYVVSLATEGQDGFFSIVQGKPDAVLLDLMLPNMDGVQILKKTRAQNQFRRMPIIVFSNAYMNGLLQEAADAGASLVFNKSEPGAVENIVKGFKDFLSGSRSQWDTEFVTKTETAPPSPVEVAAPSPARPVTKVSGLSPGRFGVVPIGKPQAATATASPTLAQPSRLETKNGDSQGSLTELDLLNVFFDGGANTMAGIRTSLRAFCKDSTGPQGRTHLQNFYRQVHSLSGVAGIASQSAMGNFSSCLVAFLRELLEQKGPLQPSALRTLASAVDVLGIMFQQGGKYECFTLKEPAVLVVDDDLLFQRLVNLSLEKADLKTYNAGDAENGLRMLFERSYELIVLDVNLPDANGFELCTKIRQMPEYEETPVCFVSSLTDFQSRAKSIMCGGSDFVCKPISSIEMTIKALSYVMKGRLMQHAATSAAPAII